MGDIKTPTEWAMATGQFTLGPKPRRVKQLSWQHNVAAVVHGWVQHEHHAQRPIALTKDDYMAAIRAIEKQMSDGSIMPHDGALSPYMKQAEHPPGSKPKTKKRIVRKRKSAPSSASKKDD